MTVATVWLTWVTSASNTTATVTSAGTNNAVWRVWADCGTAASTTTNATWVTWNQEVRFTQVQPTVWRETEADRAARMERQRQELERAKVREKQQAEARERAKKLLVEHLSAAQREQLRVAGHFDVDVKGRIYRIQPGRGHGAWVDRIEAGKVVEGFCIYAEPDEGNPLPAEDHALAHKLLLECDEEEFRRRANVHRVN